MPLDFPASPTVGQVFTSGAVTYIWNGYAWEGGGSLALPSNAIISDTPPANAQPGWLWWESDSGLLFVNYNDGTGPAQWVQINALQANAVLKTGDTMSGPLINPTKGNQFGTAGGASAAAAVAPADANIKFYDVGSGNWAGMGTDPGGNFWLRTGTSGSSPPQFWLAAAGGLNVTTTAASTSSTTGALVVAGGVGIAGATYIRGAGAGARLLVGTQQALPPVGSAIQVGYAGITEYGLALRPISDGTVSIFFSNAAGGQCGGISQTASATAYATSSSAELKEDLQSFDAGRIIDDTEVYNFKWKGLDERAYGVIAQQAIEIYPTAITHTETEEEDWWGVDYSKYVPVLLQELKAVRARLAELEAVVSPKKGR